MCHCSSLCIKFKESLSNFCRTRRSFGKDLSCRRQKNQLSDTAWCRTRPIDIDHRGNWSNYRILDHCRFCRKHCKGCRCCLGPIYLWSHLVRKIRLDSLKGIGIHANTRFRDIKKKNEFFIYKGNYLFFMHCVQLLGKLLMQSLQGSLQGILIQVLLLFSP